MCPPVLCHNKTQRNILAAYPLHYWIHFIGQLEIKFFLSETSEKPQLKSSNTAVDSVYTKNLRIEKRFCWGNQSIYRTTTTKKNMDVCFK